MKYIRIKFINSDEFDIPFDIIARNRAEYYANLDNQDNPSVRDVPEELEKEIQEEFNLVINDERKIADWLFNSMDWKDIEEQVLKVPNSYLNSDVNYEASWCNIQDGYIVGE